MQAASDARAWSVTNCIPANPIQHFISFKDSWKRSNSFQIASPTTPRNTVLQHTNYTEPCSALIVHQMLDTSTHYTMDTTYHGYNMRLCHRGLLNNFTVFIQILEGCSQRGCLSHLSKATSYFRVDCSASYQCVVPAGFYGTPTTPTSVKATQPCVGIL